MEFCSWWIIKHVARVLDVFRQAFILVMVSVVCASCVGNTGSKYGSPTAKVPKGEGETAEI